MKKLLFFLLLATSAKGQTYTYIHFPEPDLVWCGFQRHHAMGNSWNTYWTAYRYGDTVIHNRTYSMVGSAYFREDSLKRVYYTVSPDTSIVPEKLIYDFSLTVGDTMFSSPSAFFIVLSVDTYAYCGIPRRRLLVSGNGVDVIDSWAEGIGSTQWGPKGVFEACDCGITAMVRDTIPILNCSYPSCGVTNISDGNPNSPQFDIYPNPFSTQLIFSLTSNEQTTVSLYNLFGQQVLQQTFTNSTTINTEQLVSGIYFYELRNNKGVVKTGKVVRE